MSAFSNGDVICPKCKSRFSITYWTSVNVTIDPHFRERVFSGSINQHQCPDCSQGIIMEHPLLYHDTTRRFMVFFQEEVPGKQILWNTKFLEDTARTVPQYQLRFVTHWDELLEKIIIFENGWADNVIEMIKLFVTEKVYKFGTREFADCRVLLEGRKEGPEEPVLSFNVYCGGKRVSSGSAPFELYDGLARNQEGRSGKNLNAGEWKMVNKATTLPPGSVT